MTTTRSSYQRKIGLLDRVREFWTLYKLQTRELEYIDRKIDGIDGMRARIEGHLGYPLVGREVLEIGPGQRSPHMYYFSKDNRYVGIDIEKRLVDPGFWDLWEVFRTNGAMRALKTMSRIVLGLDRAFKERIAARIGAAEFEPELIRMDAAAMTFENERFDFVFSVLVFEHLPDPGQVMKEIARVLKPGGCAYILTDLYTSNTGIHDPSLFLGEQKTPYWAHLRPEHAHLVRSNCYINKRRLADYRADFETIWPGCQIKLIRQEHLAPELAKIRAAGELSEYTDEELLSPVIDTIWVKQS
ncbi:MAG: class I SAM-dependent methyltransferase [Pseudomonadota bacterium]